MSTNSIRQLLQRALDERLIEDYSERADGEYEIWMQGESIRLAPEEVRTLILALLRISRGSKNSDL